MGEGSAAVCLLSLTLFATVAAWAAVKRWRKKKQGKEDMFGVELFNADGEKVLDTDDIVYRLDRVVPIPFTEVSRMTVGPTDFVIVRAVDRSTEDWKFLPTMRRVDSATIEFRYVTGTGRPEMGYAHRAEVCICSV